MTKTKTDDRVATSESRELTALDRCDACSAAARVIATFINGELMFCGHHARKNHGAFSKKAVTVHDPDGELSAV